MERDLTSVIRQAVSAGDFRRAEQLWEAYGLECRDRMRRSPDRKAVLAEARELMVWCRQLALAARAQAQAQLNAVARRSRVAAAYGRPSKPPPGSLRAARY